ncbi:MAG: preprotein translocase subunit SecA [Candidatus Hydrogenedentes bacterium CG07_land_8_20_14_0_80_42_17]|nr:MAG: preprotein translocase subunit SecA [Candidatus Hydrogenedentes bacterium CG07_land_8_20_14_0_80_42_17]
MFQKLLAKIFGTKHARDVKRLQPIAEKINELEAEVSTQSDDDLKGLTPKFKERLEKGETLEDILPSAFAAVREISRRKLGLRHFDVQLMGGVVLHEGRIAEMKTGEGKTLVATLAVYLNALSGKGVHVITVNDYLARRDAEWMKPIYEGLGMSVGVIQHDMDHAQRQIAYNSDITYGTNNEFGFDYLRDNMVIDISHKVQRVHNFAIVDEVDSILIDEARTPLIISGPADESTQLYTQIDKLVSKLQRDTDYEVEEKDKNVTLTENGVHKAERLLGSGNLYEPQNMHLVHHLVQALRAHELYQIDVDYVVKDGEVIIVDEFTGRLMSGRRWSDGLHQAIEAKEHIPIKRENQTLATITFQNYFKLYEKLAGMTGTADTEANEFMQIYKLDVVVLPTNKNMIRIDNPDVVYKTEKEKFNAVVEEIRDCYDRGQPILVGTISIEKSEVISRMLEKSGIPHQVLNAKHHEREAEIVAQAGRLKSVTIATNMAGRGTDIVLGGNPVAMAKLRTPKNQPELFEKELEKAQAECKIEHEQVISLGGLHIHGTERHESRRIDNQLRGRSGRQGDPGSSRFMVSLEDDLMRLFGSDKVAKMMDAMHWEDGEPIIHPWVTKAIARAQNRVEMMNFDRRKRLFEYDNVMNEQRRVIYELRDMALLNLDVESYIMESAEELFGSIFESSIPEKTSSGEWNLSYLLETLNRIFASPLREASMIEGLDRDALREMLWSEILALFKSRKERFGEENFSYIIKQIILMLVDQKWKEHLYTMDSLREGIGWRGMGGTDPLVEYKHEGFALFENLIQTLRQELVTWALHVEPAVHTPQRQTRRTLIMSDEEKIEKEPVRVKKIGRNDTCPCGSGKKYKKCCGA